MRREESKKKMKKKSTSDYAEAQSSKWFTSFNIAYIGGILFVVSVALTPRNWVVPRIIQYMLTLIVSWVHLDITEQVLSNYLILVLSVFHMVVLVLTGLLLVERPHKSIAGLKIQTAGYLHTLIGFSAALFTLKHAEFGLDMLPSLGSALVTSIIGWFLGGEIERAYSPPDMSLTLLEIKENIEKFTGGDNLSVAYRNYVTTINTTAEAIEQASQNIKELSQTYRNELNRVDGYVTSISGGFEQITKSVEELVTKMEDANQYLGQSFVDSVSEIEDKFSNMNVKLHNVIRELSNVVTGLAPLAPISEQLSEYLQTLPEDATEIFKPIIGMAEKLNNDLEAVSSSASNLSTTLIKASADVEQHLGSSFLTSISEIQTKSGEIEHEMTDVAEEFKILAETSETLVTGFTTLAPISKELSKYLQSLPDNATKIIDMSDKLHNNLESVSSSVSNLSTTLTKASVDVNQHLGSLFLASISGIQTKSGEIDQEMKNVVENFKTLAETAETVETYLSQSRTLAEELEKLILFIETRGQTQN